MLDEQVVYVVPRLNPDRAEAMFARVRYGRRRYTWAFDDDNDGRVDENSREDLNGDGMITVMRLSNVHPCPCPCPNHLPLNELIRG